MVLYMAMRPKDAEKKVQECAKERDAFLFVQDTEEEDLYEDADHRKLTQEELLAVLKEKLAQGNNVVLQAFLFNRKKRRPFLGVCRETNAHTELHLLLRPYEDCLKGMNGKEKAQKKRFFSGFETPYYCEGWDSILPEETTDVKKTDPREHIASLMGFQQENPHHLETLGQHMSWTYDICRKFHNEDLAMVALLHDIGKVRAKTYVNSRGEITETAHYNNHQNMGAYEVFFFDLRDRDVLLISWLISHHMQPQFWKRENGEKAKETFLKENGEELVSLLLKLHEADDASKISKDDTENSLITEKACGAVIYAHTPEGLKYLLIRSLEGVYGLAKGHMENNETEQMTALREIREETGLDLSITDDWRESDSYYFVRNGELRQKQNVYFLAEYNNAEWKAQPEEISQICLLSLEEALEKLQFDSIKDLLKKADAYLCEKNR